MDTTNPRTTARLGRHPLHPMLVPFPIAFFLGARTTARLGRHPLHPMLVPFPIAFFLGALATDIVFWRTAYPLWAIASTWLLAAGLVMAALAAAAGLTDFLGGRAIRRLRVAWWHMIGNVVAVLIALVNLLVHFRDGAAGVLPTGLALSALTALILVGTGWLGGELVYRHRVGVAD